MKNLWIRHLRKAVPEDRERGTSFVNTLHTLARDDGKGRAQSHRRSGLQRSKSKVPYTNDRSVPALNEKDQHEKDLLITTTAPAPGSVERALSENACTELCRWTARSQFGYEAGIDDHAEDRVHLMALENGQLILRYNVSGEGIFEIGVGSLEEAENVIYEDNMTTSGLYPGISEFQWSKK